MAQEFGGLIGPQAYAKGTPGRSVRQESTGGLIASKYLPDYAQAMIDGVSYSAANQVAQAISVGLATTYTGLGLYNPTGSGVILVPKTVKFALSVAPAGIATLGLIGGTPSALTTKLTVQSTQIGNTVQGKGQAYSALFLSPIAWIDHLIDGFTAAALPAPQNGPVDLRGKFGILPGFCIAIGALTAVTGLGSITWDELPLTSA